MFIDLSVAPQLGRSSSRYSGSHDIRRKRTPARRWSQSLLTCPDSVTVRQFLNRHIAGSSGSDERWLAFAARHFVTNRSIVDQRNLGCIPAFNPDRRLSTYLAVDR